MTADKCSGPQPDLQPPEDGYRRRFDPTFDLSDRAVSITISAGIISKSRGAHFGCREVAHDIMLRSNPRRKFDTGWCDGGMALRMTHASPPPCLGGDIHDFRTTRLRPKLPRRHAAAGTERHYAANPGASRAAVSAWGWRFSAGLIPVAVLDLWVVKCKNASNHARSRQEGSVGRAVRGATPTRQQRWGAYPGAALCTNR
jgi:hypothetical protein